MRGLFNADSVFRYASIHRDASVEQRTGVAVAIAQSDGEQPWSGQRAVRSTNAVGHRRTVVGPRSGKAHDVPRFVKRCCRKLGGLKVDPRSGITVGGAAGWLDGIVVAETERRLSTAFAVHVAFAASLRRRARCRRQRSRETGLTSQLGKCPESI